MFVALLRAAVDCELEVVQTHSLSLPPPSSTSSPPLQIMIRTMMIMMIMMIKMMTMMAMMITSMISLSTFPHLATLLERTKIREYGPDLKTQIQILAKAFYQDFHACVFSTSLRKNVNIANVCTSKMTVSL